MSATLKLRREMGQVGPKKAAHLADEFRRLKLLRENVLAVADGAAGEVQDKSELEESALDVFDECGRQMLAIAERYFTATEHMKLA